MTTPHRMLGQVADGLADGASTAVRSVTGGARQVGNSIMTGLDQPCRELTGKTGPHRMVDDALNGVVGSVENAICVGGIGSVKMVGEGFQRALDNPVEQLGIPPADIGNIGLKV